MAKNVTWLDDRIEGCTRQEFNPGTVVWSRDPAMHVIHSTEGSTWPTYNGNGSSAPHFTIDPRAHKSRQHFPLTEGSWSLQVHGHPTNAAGAIAYEVIGTCDPRNSALPSVLDLDDDELAYIAHVLTVVGDALDIPATTSVDWVAYPESYGTSASQRLHYSAWDTYRGVLGHQHVPDNSHGDPGAFDIAGLLDLMGGTYVPPKVPPLSVDGLWGEDTTSAMQRAYGTPDDGEVSSQSEYWRKDNPALTTGWQWVDSNAAEGSPVIAAWQRDLGVPDDGLIGPDTIRAAEAHYGVSPDGHLDLYSSTVMAMQTSLNKNGHP